MIFVKTWNKRRDHGRIVFLRGNHHHRAIFGAAMRYHRSPDETRIGRTGEKIELQTYVF